MRKFISFSACICIVLVFVEFLVLMTVLDCFFVVGTICPHALQTCCDTPFCWKGLSDLYLSFHHARWWRPGKNGQQKNSSRFAFRMESLIQGRSPVYSSWLFLRIESVAIRCGMRSSPTVKCTQVHGWCLDGR